jgi:hypothetical protein
MFNQIKHGEALTCHFAWISVLPSQNPQKSRDLTLFLVKMFDFFFYGKNSLKICMVWDADLSSQLKFS